MKNLKKYAPFISLALVVLALVLMFVEPALVMGENLNVPGSGFKIIFGIEDGMDFNVLGFIAILLLVAGVVLPFVKDDKMFSLIAAILLIVGGILIFVFPTTIDKHRYVAWPLIIAGIFGILAGGVNIVKLVV
ncbi:MAG TPA: hypothetical protein GXX71_01730 [Acholeplasma sp.]|nr:hypothetical protein [Acholeplasma sp.]